MKRLLLFVLSLFTLFSGYAASDTWEKVTTAPETWEGDYLIVYEKGSVAFDGSLQSLDAPNNTKPVTITGNKIETIDCDFYFTIKSVGEASYYSIKGTSGKYIGNNVYSNELKIADECTKQYYNALEIDKDGNAVIYSSFYNKNNEIIASPTTLRFNKASDQNRFRYYKSGQQAIQLYKRVSVAPEPDPDPDPQPEEKTVYWDNSLSNWENVYAYAWKNGADPVENNAAWHGEQLT